MIATSQRLDQTRRPHTGTSKIEKQQYSTDPIDKKMQRAAYSTSEVNVYCTLIYSVVTYLI